MQRMLVNILSADVQRSATFYQELLGMKRHFESDWFIILTHQDMPSLEFAVLQRDHAIVPEAIQAAPKGIIFTFVVADTDAVYDRALSLGAQIVQPPTDMFYGQRRLLLEDPDGAVLDISAPTASIAQG